MSSITAQQAKFDLELVPNEKRLEIRNCNERLNPGKRQREPTFQVILDALALTLCYTTFLITADVPEGQDFDALLINEEIMSFLRELGHTGEIYSLNDVVVDHMHQTRRTFAALISKSLSGKTTSLDKHQKTISWRNKVGMHTSRDDYMINTLRFVSTKEATQIYGAILPESLTSLEMKETKAYKTYLGFATGATTPKKVRKFKKPTSPQLTTVPVSPEEPTTKGFFDRTIITTLEKEVAELKKDDPLKTQVTALVDEHLDARLGATSDEFMNFLSTSVTTRITEQVKNQLPQILPKEVSNYAPTVIQRMITESLDHAILAKESSQPHSSYKDVASLTEFELKKILIDKWIKRSRKDKDKDEDPYARSDQGLKKRKTSKDAEPTKGQKAKESQSDLSKGDKSQSKSSEKSVQSEEPEFVVADLDMQQD
uniref:Uncharacterized protein n=1 Tax=Tanacetum cinerariifolium TaxID=118510 RepID=A0A699HLR5_TANCI|nr:hypothetical protein [Tanacetum cinerariifolium]